VTDAPSPATDILSIPNLADSLPGLPHQTAGTPGSEPVGLIITGGGKRGILSARKYFRMNRTGCFDDGE